MHAAVLTATGSTVASPRIRTRDAYTDDDVADFCDRLCGAACLVTDVPALTRIVRDPHDDVVIATAVYAQAPHMVTRDDDLLALQQDPSLTITTPEAFMALWRAQGLVAS